MRVAWITSFVLAGVMWGVLLWVLIRIATKATRLQAQLGVAFEYLHLLEAVFEAAQSVIVTTGGESPGVGEEAGHRLSSAVAAVESFEIRRLPPYRGVRRDR